MNTTRRTFIKTGFGIIATGVALPQILFAADKSTFGAGMISLNNDAYFTGSSFFGTVDDNPQTGWTPMEEKGPYWLEMRWRYPVRMSGFRWTGKNFSAANLQVLQKGEYTKLIDLRNASGEIHFPEIVTDRLRFYITEFSDKPIVLSTKVPVSLAALTGHSIAYHDDGRYLIDCLNLSFTN